jgi:hypothetical protein
MRLKGLVLPCPWAHSLCGRFWHKSSKDTVSKSAQIARTLSIFVWYSSAGKGNIGCLTSDEQCGICLDFSSRPSAMPHPGRVGSKRTHLFSKSLTTHSHPKSPIVDPRPVAVPCFGATVKAALQLRFSATGFI